MSWLIYLRSCKDVSEANGSQVEILRSPGVSGGHWNQDIGESHKGWTTDGSQLHSWWVCGCVPRKINFHFLGRDGCFFSLYSCCLAFFFLNKQTWVCPVVRVSHTAHKYTQIINCSASDVLLVPGRRWEFGINAQKLYASRSFYLSCWIRGKGAWVHRVECLCVPAC
jgi:hypothetical protein